MALLELLVISSIYEAGLQVETGATEINSAQVTKSFSAEHRF